MRLTLRNLLAYMDDLLDPESARIIGQKTEESEFASGLLHRIRDVSRRTKLGAPEVIDRKAALDPNTVAEYLDNTLPTDRVTDFEKVCLDSDVELAEVAACHQILTLVLGEPAEVHPESRVRMYHLPETAASQTYVESDEPTAGRESRRIDIPAISPARHRQPAVPEYLLAARRRRRLYYWGVTTAVVLCIALYLGATGGLSGLFGGGEKPADLDDQVAAVIPAQPELPEKSGSFPEPSISAEASPSTPKVQAESTGDAAVSPSPTDVAIVPSGPAMTTPDGSAEPQAVPELVVPVTPTPGPSPTMDAASETAIPAMPVEPVTLPPGPAPDPGQVAAVTVPAGLPDGRESIAVEPMVPEAPDQGRDIAQLFTPEEMALVTDDWGEQFHRVSNSEPLKTGQHVVSLPTSRPMLLIDGKLHVEMVDGGELLLLPSDENGPLNLDIVYGRALFGPAEGAAPVAVSLHVGGVVGTLTLADSTSSVAIEVGRADGPIADPLTRPAQTTARLWHVLGSFSWTTAGGAETSFDSPIAIDLTGSNPNLPSEAPEWVKTDLTSKLARQASGMLNRALELGEDADMALRENALHRRTEVRDLARQCLSWIEDFKPIVPVLDDPERYTEWPELIDLLRGAVRRGPRTAQAVRDAMGVEYGNRADELYELLWKFDAKELSGEDSKRLVQYLDDKELACRVLSFNNLNRITKLGYYYRPEKSELERRPSVKRWADWAERRPGTAPPKPLGAVAPADSNQPPSGL
jgi:hypothetical protein